MWPFPDSRKQFDECLTCLTLTDWIEHSTVATPGLNLSGRYFHDAGICRNRGDLLNDSTPRLVRQRSMIKTLRLMMHRQFP